MKRLFLLLVLSLAVTVAEAQVRWIDGSTDEVREMAVKSDKLVFIALYADWCGPFQMTNTRGFTRK